MTHTYYIKGMTCLSCVAKVKSALLKLGDITEATVQLADPQATVTLQQPIPLSRLQEALSQAGPYTITTADSGRVMEDETIKEERSSYFPIFLIFGYIAGISLLVEFTQGTFQLMRWMQHFMAGFFLVFSFFKLLNLKGFAEGYRSYDIVAKKWPLWGALYPFVELLLGIAFLTGIAPLVTNSVAFFIMAISSIGVVQSLLKKSPFQCACLGTIIKLPLSKVTLVEDLLMVAMSGVMILLLLQ